MTFVCSNVTKTATFQKMFERVEVVISMWKILLSKLYALAAT
jgi:hypothetical protein